MRTNSKTTTAVSVKNTPIIWASLIMVLIVLFVTQFAHAQVQGNPCNVPASGNPCPPPVSKIQKPSRPIGTNGAVIEFQPVINFNSGNGCGGSLPCGQQYFVPAVSSTYSGWEMFTCGAIFFILALFIGFLIGYLLRHHAGNGTSNSGNKNPEPTTNRFFPENNHILRNVFNVHLHEAPVRTNAKKASPESK